MLSRAAHLLKQAEWLIKIHGHSYLREVFPNGILEDGPDADFHLRVFEKWKGVSLWEVKWMSPLR